jgi:hypothetical protein
MESSGERSDCASSEFSHHERACVARNCGRGKSGNLGKRDADGFLYVARKTAKS